MLSSPGCLSTTTMAASSCTRPRPRGKGTRPRVPRTTRSLVPTMMRPSRQTRPLSSTRPDSSHCLRLRPEASGKSARSLAESVAASFTAKNGERPLAEEPEGAEKAHAEGESRGGRDAPGDRAGGATPPDIERPVQHTPSKRSCQRGAAEPRRRAQERVFHGEDARDEAARGAERLEYHALVETLVPAHSQRPGSDDETCRNAHAREQTDCQCDLIEHARNALEHLADGDGRDVREARGDRRLHRELVGGRRARGGG